MAGPLTKPAVSIWLISKRWPAIKVIRSGASTASLY